MLNKQFIIDNNIFSSSLRKYDIDQYPCIYQPWSESMEKRIIISVHEVYKELEQRFHRDGSHNNSKEWAWISKHRQAFEIISSEESIILLNLFNNNNKFCEGIKERNFILGNPEADAILVAKAKSLNGIIVTNESNKKPNSEKIPNICVSLGVPYINIDDFFRVLDNISNFRDPLLNIDVKFKLECD
jgi:hypothetical protein